MNDDDWFMDINNLPKALSNDEIHELFELVASGSKDAREKLIVNNIRLVLYQVSKEFRYIEYDKKELVSIGIVGLIEAIDTFDISKKFYFSTYASKCINNKILVFIRKLKKSKKIDSINDIMGYKKDDNRLRLEEMLSDVSDIACDYEQNETYTIIRKIINELPERDKEIIMLAFGFYDDRIYNQREISNMLNISPASVSRCKKIVLKKLGKKFEKEGLIEINSQSKYNLVNKDITTTNKIKSIYEILSGYSKEKVDKMIESLSDEEKKLLTLRYGQDLSNPIVGELSKEQYKQFYMQLLPKMKRRIKNVNKVTKESNNKSNESYTDEIVDLNNKDNFVDKEPLITEKIDNINISETLDSSVIMQIIKTLSSKEAIIICLKFGYVDEKYFSSKCIADFLKISEIEVIDTIKKVLLLYKKNIINLLDDNIEKEKNNSQNKLILN